MNLLKSLSIRTKLILLSLVPVLAFGFYLQKSVRDELVKKQAAEELIQNIAQIEKMGNMLDNLQKERSLSIVYLFLRTEKSRQTLNVQRKITDTSVDELGSFVKTNGLTLKNMWLLDSLPSIRQKIDQLKYTERDSEKLVEGRTLILSEINKILFASKSAAFTSNIDDHITLLYAKDFLSIIRSQIAEAMINGKFDEQAFGIFYSGKAYGAFASTKGKYDAYINKMRSVGEPEFVQEFNTKFRGEYVNETIGLIDSVFNDPRFSGNDKAAQVWASNANDSEGIQKFNRWFEMSTASLDLLKEVEDFSLALIQRKAGHEVAQANTIVTQTFATSGFVILVIFGITFLTIRGIVDAVNEIKTAANLLAIGNTEGITLEIKSKDEIGELAMAFKQMIASTRDFSLLAEAMGKGDYTQEVAIRGSNDTLGKALSTMRTDLHKLSEDNKVRTWLLSGNSELNDRLRGEKDVQELAQEVVTKLVTYLRAQIGAIYLKENNHLSLVGSYAFQHRKNNSNSVRLGEGLVGQAALEKKLIVFTDVPEDYIKINSGLGQSTPHTIIVFPFVYEGDVKGVIEIGSVYPFTDLDMQFLEMISNSVAVAFNGAQSRTKLKDLLEETQRQAEELQSQQEELKQSNEELVEKTDLLERSEAELKAQQEELQQTNEELEEKANLLEEQKETLQLTKVEIERKAGELEAISKYKSEFLANMSHELRTPLNSILILSQLLSENKHNVLGEKEMEFAKNINNSGTDLLNLINEILDLAKVESGKLQLDVEEVLFEEIQQDVAAMFTEVAKTKSIEFTHTVAGNLGTGLTTDRQRLQQITRNLLSNAFKFTAKGGHVSLTISKPPANVVYKDHALASIPDMIAIAVKDNGIGIPPEKQGLVFEAFQQADGSTKRKYGGTGLGLSICKELAIALGGEIQLVSEAGQGSTFTLYLPSKFTGKITAQEDVEIAEKPVVSSRPQKQTHELPAEQIDSQSGEPVDDRDAIKENDKVVVIMEDDEAFAKVMLDFVRDRNYKGIIAHQGNTGLSLARHYKPDAIMLDMKLPMMEGTEVLRHLKNDPSTRHIPVQIISGYDFRKQGMELGAFDFIQKPVAIETLQQSFDRIEDFISRKIKKLLIVEDNELQNKAIRELTGNGEVKCFSSYTGKEAIELISKEKFDCIIVDLGLPDMSGLDLLEKIKDATASDKIPVIVYTGKDLSKEETQKLNKLANTVVLKTADSHERLLDETMLFLHQVESKLPKEKQKIIRKLYKADEVLKNKIVLVVDDDMRNIYSLTNVLKEEGMQCIVAENGLLALKALEEKPSIEIVLMDVMMPEMDGYEATRAIRKLKNFEKLPIIALTAKAMKGDREKCLKAGMSDYISKPVNIEQLLSLMRVWLYKK